MAKSDIKLIGEMLVDDGVITREQLDEALKKQQQGKEKLPIGEMLIRLGYLGEEALALALGKKLGTDYLSFSDGSLVIRFDHQVQDLLDHGFAQTNLVLPISKTARNIFVVMWNPLNYTVLDNIKKLTGLEPVVYCGTRKDILDGIEQLYMRPGGIGTMGEGKAGAAKSEAEQLKMKASEAPIIKLVNTIIREAVRQHSSDIHIEPLESGVSLRYRIDGVLYAIDPPATDLIAAIVSRIKILSRIDIAEKRLPQDGGFMVKTEGRSIDFRVSTIPTIYGEKVVMRILDKEAVSFKLDAIGFSPEDLKKVSAAIHRPHGLIFITGPTGSGKSTTLYCILNEIISPRKNILTIEDPVEYRMNTVNQVQAMPNIGLTFAAGLRAFLRQDPDVIMVGEVRDLETAEICVRSALVGRLVLSTLHTNDSVGTISRLIDFGVEPFLVGSTIRMAIAQRLVRKLCDKCKEPASLDPKILAKYRLNKTGIFIPKGCKECHNRGYSGRAAIFEIMTVDEDIRRMVEQRKDVGAIKNTLAEKGLRSLREDGLDKVRQGITSLDEVLSTTMEGV